MGQFVTPENFMSRVEEVVREHIKDNPVVHMWRGSYPHDHLGKEFKHDTVVVGMGDDRSLPPTTVFLMVWCEDQGGNMCFYSHDVENNITSVFGVRGTVLKEIEKVAPLLQEMP